LLAPAQTLLKRQIAAAGLSACNAQAGCQIDRPVYALYELTEEEIEIVEKGVQ